MISRNSDISVIGSTNFRNRQQKFGIKQEDRRRHMYVIGKTGMGKSQLLENMAIQDICNGRGVAVVDPHGDMIERILKFIPNDRTNDVVYFNPADLDNPIAFNVLEKVDSAQRHLVASGLIAVFQKIWASSWGPRLEYVLYNAISALLEYPGSTLLGIMRMLTDKAFRKKVIEKIHDPVVKAFWVEEYSKYPDRFQSEAIAPIQNKVGRFLASSLMRNIIGQVQSTINVREIMDNKKIFLINLSKGRVGEDNSALLGALLITKMQLAAMSRVDIPEEERKDFYLYVDEFQNFATESFAGILSEARKYRLNIILAHQYIAQLVNDQSSAVRDAVFGNVGTIVTFRVGAADAEFMEPEFAPDLTQEDLVNLPKFQIYIKLMIDGVTSSAFSAATLPPFDLPENSAEQLEKIIRVSRERYAKPRAEIEDKIIRWSENSHDEKPKPSKDSSDKPAKKKQADSKRTSETPKNTDSSKVKGSGSFESTCSICGDQTKVKFKPDGKRPVYCPECLKDVKSGKYELTEVVDEKQIPGEISLLEAIGGVSENGPDAIEEKSINEPKKQEGAKSLQMGEVVTFKSGD